MPKAPKRWEWTDEATGARTQGTTDEMLTAYGFPSPGQLAPALSAPGSGLAPALSTPEATQEGP